MGAFVAPFDPRNPANPIPKGAIGQWQLFTAMKKAT
jgi:hypothetical protein